MSSCGMGGRFFGPIENLQADEIARELCDDKNLCDLMRRFMSGEIETVQLSGEFQILCETYWIRIFGSKQRRDIHDIRN